MEARKKGEPYERMDIINNEDMIRNKKLIAHLASESPDGFVIPPALQTIEGILALQKYWMKNAEFIKDNIGKVDDETYSIIITRHPLDIWRMSDFEGIESCHSPPSRGGESNYYKCAVADSHGHGAVAYAVRTEELLENYGSGTIESVENDPDFQSHDDEVFYDQKRPDESGPMNPISRVRFRQMKAYKTEQDARPGNRFQTGTEIAVPEFSVYGEDMIGIGDRLTKWARANQEEAMKALQYFTSSEGLAGSAKHIAYAPFRISSLDVIMADEPWFYSEQAGAVEIMPHMPTAPKVLKRAIIADPVWWADNGAEVHERFGAWKGS